MTKVLQGGSQKHVVGDRAEWGGVEGEMGKIVPGGGRDPGVLALGGLSANEAGGIGDAEGTDGSDVEEKRVINGFWDEAMANFLLEVLGRWDEDGKR
jgi:hypothetical protein